MEGEDTPKKEKANSLCGSCYAAQTGLRVLSSLCVRACQLRTLVVHQTAMFDETIVVFVSQVYSLRHGSSQSNSTFSWDAVRKRCFKIKPNVCSATNLNVFIYSLPVAYLHQVALNFKPSTSSIQHTIGISLPVILVSGTEHAHYCVHVTVFVDVVVWQLKGRKKWKMFYILLPI